MNRHMRWILAALLLLALPCAALAEAGLGEYVYGNWSEWSTTWARSTETLDVQTRRARELVLKEIWTYRRFVYFNKQANAWYATSTDRPGAIMRAGSGHWEEKHFEARKAVIGRVDGEIEYAGHWFFEKQGSQVSELKPTFQYRTRAKTKVVAKLRECDMAMARGETRQIQIDLIEGLEGVRYVSSNESVIQVQPSGLIKALSAGTARVEVMVGEKRVERVRVSVGERVRGFSSAVHAIRVHGTELYLSPVKGGRKAGVALVASDSVNAKRRLFRFVGQADSAFRIRLAAQRVLFVSAVQKDKLLRLDARGGGKLDQLFSVLRLRGGRDLLYLASDPTRFLTAGKNGMLEFKPYDAADPMMRWEIVEQGEDAQYDGLWSLPYRRDGRCYISANYIADVHKGIDVGSSGERVDVLSVAAGKVAYVYKGCSHDYGKKPNKKGKIKDPCGNDRSYGNQVVVEHANGVRTAYAHLSRVTVKEGDAVKQGDVLGISGSTGQSTAVHLHFEVRQGKEAVNPRLYIEFPKVNKAD